ncbi:MAG: ABC transporter ATP-binding protein [Cytophagales bacterium]|nr:MAG: ABC transporter ATP-binding protein [Cytophagales bacterium]TAH27984.1 MAG: ABC transporter ATP-binding protein [Cytophagales bacterium]
MHVLSTLNKYFFKYKWLLFWGTIFTIISNVFSIMPGPLVRYAFDLIERSIKEYNLHTNNAEKQRILFDAFAYSVLVYGGLIVLMAVIKGVFLFFMRQTIIVMSRHIEYDMKNEIYAHYQKLPLSFYRKNNTGDLMARISEDVGQVRMYVGPAIMYGINLVTLLVMVISFMFFIDAKLSFYALLPLPILSISIYYVSNQVNQQSTKLQKSLSNLSNFVQQSFSGVRVIKAYSRELDSVDNFAKESEVYKQEAVKLSYIEALFYPFMLALVGLSTILVIYVGGIEVINGKITSGVIAEFIIYITMLTWPVTAIGWITSIAQRASASQVRINEFLNTKNDIISEKNLIKEIEGKIIFKNVTLTYPDTNITAIKNINFEIRAGENLAILGTTGSGKSTIANLIARMYDVSEGEILIDGHNIKDFDVTNLRQQIGYVPQDVFLFSDSIKNNLTFGSPTIAEEQIIQAAKDADLYQNIMDFPEQFETKIGERGITLSGGQKQRLSMARAIIRNPKILMLDDSLSAVDTKTENIILNNLKRIMQNRTSIIISHRVSSAKLASKIIVLDEGKIVEMGTHEELIANNGAYKELYEKQLVTETEVE